MRRKTLREPPIHELIDTNTLTASIQAPANANTIKSHIIQISSDEVCSKRNQFQTIFYFIKFNFGPMKILFMFKFGKASYESKTKYIFKKQTEIFKVEYEYL